ncbi:hypothetical protein HK104_007972, partial [Borealophlyctis nickersoniae]
TLDASTLEQALFQAVHDGNREALSELFDGTEKTRVLQMLLTTSLENEGGGGYKLDAGVEQDELLGPSLQNLNLIQLACVLGEEDLAIDILNFVALATEEIDSRKVLYEFMGRVWGNGNTVLHLAAFQGMSELVKRLLELGATVTKKNERMYRPVDCAGDEVTLQMFMTVTEGKGGFGSLVFDDDARVDSYSLYK